MKKLSSWYKFYLGLSIVLWLVYFYITLTASVDESTNKFHLTLSQMIILRASIAVPFLIIWFVGTLGLNGVVRYLTTIANSNEAKGFYRITTGIAVLLLGLVLGAAVGSARLVFAGNEVALINIAVIVNYISVFMPLIAFAYIFAGADYLAGLVSKSLAILSNPLPVILTLSSAIFYTWIIFSNPDRQFGVGPQHTGASYLPDGLFVLTVMLPYIIMWALGIFAAVRLTEYRRSVGGEIYRSALSGFRDSIAFIIGLSISLQALKLLSDFFATANLQVILVAVYLILLAIAIGYVLLWLAARKLTRIETA